MKLTKFIQASQEGTEITDMLLTLLNDATKSDEDKRLIGPILHKNYLDSIEEMNRHFLNYIYYQCTRGDWNVEAFEDELKELGQWDKMLRLIEEFEKK